MTRLLHRLSFVLHAVFGQLDVLPFCMVYFYQRRTVTGVDPGFGLLRVGDRIRVGATCTKRRGHLGGHAE